MSRAMMATAACALALAVLASACTGEKREGDVRQQGRAGALPADVRPMPGPPTRWSVGRRASAAEVAAWDIDVGPEGRELPPGRGTPARGAALFAQKCAMCHGAKGEGTGQGQAAYPRLIGREPRDGFPFGRDAAYAKTVGNYWPYATTLFDYVRRAMPLTAPGSLADDETYSLVAFLLAENEIVARDATLDARALRAVRMPARDRFVRDDRRGGPGFR
jgi:cytochrome c